MTEPMTDYEYFDTPGNFWIAVLAASCFKFLFLHSYRSTDFEVHRNWLALTHSLPMKDWYYENTSEWTLDYPPFFAFFELGLAQIAQFFDLKMLNINNLNYSSDQTILFQKSSVIFMDLVLAYGTIECAKAVHHVLPNQLKNSKLKLFVLIFINGGLFIVDHIHFQYNGFLFGVLLLSMSRIIKGRYLQGAFLFSVLLNLKHIFLYMAPAFGVFLFAKYCVKYQRSWFPLRMKNLISLGSIVIFVFLASFGPFYAHLPQILGRLFPFRRGLCHAYWAPNFWAAYSSLDVLLNFVLKKGKSFVTSGLVGEHPLSVLPTVLPIHTFVITLVFMIPAMYKIWRQPTEKNFVLGVIATAWTAFMFGYHVHEKAILNVIIPFALVSSLQPKLYVLAFTSGLFSLFPLLFTPFEIVFKFLMFLFCYNLSLMALQPLKLDLLEKGYILGFAPLYFVENFGPHLFSKYSFLPLVCVSNYCFVGLFYSYVLFYWNFVSENTVKKSETEKKSCKEDVQPAVVAPVVIGTKQRKKRKVL